MSQIRMTEFPVLEEIRSEYVELRQAGNNRALAVQKLTEAYEYELAENENDAMLFWIGLADAQYFRKELTEDVAFRASEALDELEKLEWQIASCDLNRRREHYTKAPMPERKTGKPRPKFRCEWQIGDTFAYQLTSQEAKDLGIVEKYMLLRKVAELECAGGMYPVVTVSFHVGEHLPSNSEEFLSIPLLKLQEGGRCFSPRDKFEYRTVIFIKSLRQLHSLSLQYCGNFTDVPLPADEIVFNRFGETMISLADALEEDLCMYWERNNRITSMKK